MAKEKTLRNNVAEWLNAYKGIKEGSTEHKKLISIFNDSGLCSRYKMTVNDAWCAMAASCPFIDLGLKKIAPFVECSCANMITLAKNAGLWVEDDTYTPGIGDLLLYDWDDGTDYASTDDKNSPDHVGIVQNVSGSEITVIEGNKSDTVGTRSVKVNGRYIRGYITPDYASVASSTSSEDEALTFAVGDIVTFTGSKHYTSANASGGKTCKGGEAEVTQICKGAKHPYHLIHTGSGCTVYGWVDEADVKAVLSSSGSTSTSEKKATDAAQSFDKSIAGTYKTTANLNMRNGAGTSKSIMVTLPKSTKVQNYGYYTKTNGTRWLYVQVTYDGIKYTGFCSEEYLSKQ